LSELGRINLFGNNNTNAALFDLGQSYDIHPDELAGMTEEESIAKQIREEREYEEMSRMDLAFDGAGNTAKEAGIVYSITVLLKDLLKTTSKESALLLLQQAIQNADLDIAGELEQQNIVEEKAKYKDRLMEEVKQLDAHYTSFLEWLFDNEEAPNEDSFPSPLQDLYKKEAEVLIKRSDLRDMLYSWRFHRYKPEITDDNRMYLKYFRLYIDLKFIADIKNPTEHMQLYAVYKDAKLIEHITNPTYKAKYLSITLEPDVIKFLPDADDSLKLLAVRAKGSVIQHITKPSKDVQLAAVKQDLDALNFITKPHKEVLEYLKK